MALETKWEDKLTIISKVHGISPLKVAVDDKHFLLTCSTFMKLINCLWHLMINFLHKY